MGRDVDLRKERNDHILARFKTLRKKNPKWTMVAVIEEVAKEMFLKPATVGGILKRQGTSTPCVHTIVRRKTKFDN